MYIHVTPFVGNIYLKKNGLCNKCTLYKRRERIFFSPHLRTFINNNVPVQSCKITSVKKIYESLYSKKRK